jgi:hypothetical protein
LKTKGTKVHLNYMHLQRVIRGLGHTFNEATGRHSAAIMH